MSVTTNMSDLERWDASGPTFPANLCTYLCQIFWQTLSGSYSDANKIKFLRTRLRPK